MNNAASYIRQSVPSFQWVWAAEPNPLGTGNHAHGFYYSDKPNREIPKGSFDYAKRRAGIGGRMKVDPILSGAPVKFFAYGLQGSNFSERKTIDKRQLRDQNEY
ncbi:MAG TPA: hypothetical protein VMU68_11695 [Acidimicrobiales bacterium]|nr:hypothetical protein [Acidimicrobiales bacterium]